MTPALDTNVTLAGQANYALYASMIVFALAMLMFVWHLAARAPKVSEAKVAEAAKAAEASRDRELVAAGAGVSSTERPDAADRGGSGLAAASGAAADAGSEAAGGDEVGVDGGRVGRQRGAIALMFTYLATALLVASVAMRGIAVARPPWGNMFEFATAACAAVALVYCLLAKRNKWEWLGLFIVLPVLLTLGVSLVVLYTEAGELMPALKSYWLGIHVTVAVLAIGFFTVAFALGCLYLVRNRRAEQGKTGSFIESLPPAKALENAAYSLNIAGFILWTFTLIAGSIWAKDAWGTYWQWDPKEVWTFVIWTIYAAYMHARATAGVDLRRAHWIAFAGYVAVIINFTVINLVPAFGGMHNYSGM